MWVSILEDDWEHADVELSTASTGCFSSVFYTFYVECFTYLSTDFCSCAKLTTFARTRLGISCKKVFKRP